MANGKKDSYWIGFDLGGTKMLASVFNRKLNIVGNKRRRTKGNEGAKSGLNRIQETILDALKDAGVKPKQLSGIGMACPGPLDMKNGVLIRAPNLGWTNVPIKETLESPFHAPPFWQMTSTLACSANISVVQLKKLAVWSVSSPAQVSEVGCVYKGSIFTNSNQSCMEIGHIPIVQNGDLCGCGRRGCLETVASRLAIASKAAKAAYRGQAPHLLKEAGTDLYNIRSSALANSIKAGDKVIEKIIRNSAATLGRTLGGVVNLLAPDVLVLGGGLVEAMPDLFCEEVEAAAKETAMPAYAKALKVCAAELGDDAGVTGAAAWAQTLTETSTS